MTFGERLKQLRNEAGLSLTDLSLAAGVHRQTVIDYEGNRRSPSLEVAQRIAAAVGHPVTVFDGVEFLHASRGAKAGPSSSDDSEPTPPPEAPPPEASSEPTTKGKKRKGT